MSAVRYIIEKNYGYEMQARCYNEIACFFFILRIIKSLSLFVFSFLTFLKLDMDCQQTLQVVMGMAFKCG